MANLVRRLITTINPPATAQEYLEQHDREVSLPAPAQPIFDLMLLGCTWRSGDGPIPGVFYGPAKEKGNRCLWSCRWATSTWGLLEPERWMPVGAMTSEQLVAEATDVLYRGIANPAGQGLTRLALDYMTGDISSGSGWLAGMRQALADLRLMYVEYTPSWDFPGLNGKGPSQAGRLMRIAPRPGWSTKSELVGILGG